MKERLVSRFGDEDECSGCAVIVNKSPADGETQKAIKLKIKFEFI